MKDFSKITSPLTNLLKKATQFEWIEKCECAFQELTHWLATTPILTLPVKGDKYNVYSDASRNGLWCVLMWDDEVVAYASLQLKPYEKNYPAYDLKSVAVVFALKF